MTKFDPNATPKTDRNKFYLSELEIIEGSETPVVETWFAEDLERRARLAEEKLRIATNCLNEIRRPSNGVWCITQVAYVALRDIKEVGK